MIDNTARAKFFLFAILFFAATQTFAGGKNSNTMLSGARISDLAAQAGEKIAFASSRTGNSEIYTANPDGSNQTNVSNHPEVDGSPRFSSDGRKIVFVRQPSLSNNQTDIYTMNLDGSNQVRLTFDGGSYAPDWSPDGSKIVFARGFGIYTMNADGSNQTVLPPTGYNSAPVWSPDGTRIAYLCSRPFNGTPPGANDEICVMNADGSNEKILSNNPADESGAAWSPDSSKIAFNSNRDRTSTSVYEVYVMNADGSNQVNVSNNPASDRNPVWSPDGAKIAFFSSRDIPGYYLMNADGSNQTLVSGEIVVNSWKRVLAGAAAFDFDGDGKTDASVFRNGTWFVNSSSANNPNSFSGTQFGLASDTLVPADYDGDNKTDFAVWRENVVGTFGYFFIFQSSTNTFRSVQFGNTGDDPRVVGDWDGDGRTDLAVYRSGASAGAQSYFYYRPSSQPSVNFATVPWGTRGDEPVRGDFDGDGRADAAVFRASDGIWYIRQSSNNQVRYERWGLASDKRVAGDFDADGKTDLAIFRDGLWAVLQSSNNQARFVNWGLSTDRLTAGDYDGDGRTDFAVWRAGVYYILQSSNSQAAYQAFGVAGDVPAASAFVR